MLLQRRWAVIGRVYDQATLRWAGLLLRTLPRFISGGG